MYVDGSSKLSENMVKEETIIARLLFSLSETGGGCGGVSFDSVVGGYQYHRRYPKIWR